MNDRTTRSGGEVLVAALAQHGVEVIFGVPGESYLGALDALYDRRATMRFIVCRHEAAGAHMGEAYGKLTGRPGVVMVTRGPGATHAAIGVHTAKQDSTPLVLIVGLPRREHLGREAWQEIDVRTTFATLAKYAEQIDEARRMPEAIARAFTTALQGRPGPVVLGIPEDVLTDEVDVADAAPVVLAPPGPSTEQLAQVADLLARAERPLVLVGGSGWTTEACEDLRAFAEAHGKRLSVPEWGNVSSGTSAGGDDPLYVQDMRAFFAANAAHIAFESNFQGASTGGSYGAGTTVPNAAAAYRAGFLAAPRSRG